MNTPASLPDAKGIPVVQGDYVRILDVTPDPDMDDDDRDMVEYMIGSICEVDSIDEYGQAWVTMWWNNVEGVITTTVALESSQMERVEHQEASRRTV